jgi:hypothetical protein
MAPTNIRHPRIQRNVSEALRGAIAAAGLPCEVFDAGPGVALDANGDECRIPDVFVTFASTIDEAARLCRGCLAVDQARGCQRQGRVLWRHRIDPALSRDRAGSPPRRLPWPRAERRPGASDLAGEARSRSTHPAFGSVWMPSIRTRSSPRPEMEPAAQAAAIRARLEREIRIAEAQIQAAGS